MGVVKKSCCHNRLIYIVIPCFISIYLMLSWKQCIPSVLHIPFIRNIWDKKFSVCMSHINRESILPQDKRQLTYITAKLSGRLGNWLFAYASLLGIAKKNNVKFFTLPDADLRVSLQSIFKVTHVKSISPFCSQPVYENLPCAYDPKMELLPLSNVTIHGYLQSWKYFDQVEDELRKELTFHDHLWKKAKKLFRYYVYTKKTASIKTTCIHVRRTDMMIPSSTTLGFKAAPQQYIINAANYFRSKLNGTVKFVVVSDDYQWCIENLQLEDSVIIPKHSSAIDLALLSMCNNSIITTGTFGWWGAWLANGHTVYYKNYPEPGTRLDRDTVRKDYYPPHWVPINGAKNQMQSIFSMVLLLLIALFTV